MAIVVYIVGRGVRGLEKAVRWLMPAALVVGRVDLSVLRAVDLSRRHTICSSRTGISCSSTVF
jgi:hypothetical protein